MKRVTKNISEMALKGLNDHISRLLEKYKISKNTKILVLGSGQGILEYGLLQKGYKDITSIDYFADFKLKNKCKFISIDLNSNKFCNIIKEKNHKTYDIILAIEIIEHLHNPYIFLKNIKELLSDKGIAIISTPNVHSFLSRVDYLLTGYPTFFITRPTKIGGHISPIFHNIFEFYLNNLGLEIIEQTSYGSLSLYLKTYKIYSFKSIIYLLILSFFYYLFRPLMLINRKIAKGLISIYIIQKSKNKQNLILSNR